MCDTPFFILGTNRSGTTLLRLMLNAHSRLAVPEELEYIRSYLAGVPIKRWRAPNLSADAYASFARSFADRVCQIHDEFDLHDLHRRMTEAPHTLRSPYQVVGERWAQMHGKARWGEKTPGNLFYVDVLHDMFPQARFIYVARDPRAGVASMQRADFFSQDIVFNSLSRRKHFEAARTALLQHVPPHQWINIRYEDLVHAPAPTLSTVCNFLQEDFEPGILTYYRTAADYMKGEAASSFSKTATEPVTPRRIDAWRNQLSPASVTTVEAICIEEMTAFQYESTGQPEPLLNRANRLVKTLYWHWQLLRHWRNRHYTVRYPILARFRHRVNRRLGLLTALSTATD